MISFSCFAIKNKIKTNFPVRGRKLNTFPGLVHTARHTIKTNFPVRGRKLPMKTSCPSNAT